MSPGTYQNLTARSSCPACPVGLVALLPGAFGKFTDHLGVTVCAACGPGLHQPRSGQTACDSCPPGSLNSNQTGLSACLLCSPGQYNDGFGATQCTACGTGYYQAAAGQA